MSIPDTKLNVPSFRLEHHRLQFGELPNNPRGRVPATNVVISGGPGAGDLGLAFCCCERDLQRITRASKLMATADTIDHRPRDSKEPKNPWNSIKWNMEISVGVHIWYGNWMKLVKIYCFCGIAQGPSGGPETHSFSRLHG